MFILVQHKGTFFQLKILGIFLHENICGGYTLEVPQKGTSNEYLE